MGRKTKMVNYLFDNQFLKNIPQYDKLILQLLIMQERRNPDTKLQNFLDSIPKDWSNFPVLYTKEEWEYLQGSQLITWTNAEIQIQKKQYDFFADVVPDFKETYPFEEFLATSRAVNSRIFDYMDDDRQKIIMLPFGDLFNHRNPPDLIWGYGTNAEGRYGWVYKALNPVKRGEQVYVSYGAKKNNQELLPVYGFIDDNCFEPFNPHLTLKIRKSDPLIDLKKKILGPNERQVVIEQVPDVEALSLLRVASLEGVENAGLLESMVGVFQPNSGLKVSPISLENEVKAMKNLGKMCAKAIQAYPKSFQEDYDSLETEELSFNKKNALKYTLYERKALIELAELSE